MGNNKFHFCPDHQLNATQVNQLKGYIEDALQHWLLYDHFPTKMSIPIMLTYRGKRFRRAFQQLWNEIDENQWPIVASFLLQRAGPKQLEELQPQDLQHLLEINDHKWRSLVIRKLGQVGGGKG